MMMNGGRGRGERVRSVQGRAGHRFRQETVRNNSSGGDVPTTDEKVQLHFVQLIVQSIPISNTHNDVHVYHCTTSTLISNAIALIRKLTYSRSKLGLPAQVHT